MVDAGEELTVNEDASLSEFVEQMRRQTEQMVVPMFGDEEPDLRLAALKATFVEPSAGFSASPGIDAQWFEEEEFEHGVDEYQRLVQEFASENNLGQSDIDSQWSVVEEEIEEMFEAFEAYRYTMDAAGAREALAEEMADAIFTIHLLAHLAGVNLRREFIEKANYNLEKSGQRDESGKIIDDAEDDQS
jgi:NTP pyrophosphatase (non-canonical NTP hydrolase)